MSARNKTEDRLSSLPEELLSHILSLIPTIYAVRTSILSKRWRYTWTMVTNLDIDSCIPACNLNCFSTYVDRVLERCKTSQLNSFRLSLYGARVEKSEVSKWINEAVKLNVSELDIKVTRTELPLSLYTCKTLTKFELVLIFNDLDVFDDLPSVVMLPGLKTLSLIVLSRPSVNIIKFIHGCPVLESLFLKIMRPDDDEQDYNFNIPTLKRLELGRIISWPFTSKVVLNVPNLEYLVLHGGFCPYFVMEDLPSSVEFSRSRLPKFPNLKHLELKDSFDNERLLVIQFLENSPELEHLSFQEPEESSWIEPQSVPTCMLSNLKTVKIEKCKGRKCALQFLEFMLGHAEVLKTLTITCENLCREDEMEMCGRLLKFQRASRYCELHFVGKWINSFSR